MDALRETVEEREWKWSRNNVAASPRRSGAASESEHGRRDVCV